MPEVLEKAARPRLKIGPHTIDVPVIVAPMAGMTDLPFRETAREWGAGYAIGEMTASHPRLRDTKKSSTRWADANESGLKVVQLLGADPLIMADAARYAEDSGADVVDINMGCPAKKVLQRACGSALMKDEALVAEILREVVKAVQIPVTLKTRLGWDQDHRNVLRIGEIAQEEGVQCLTIHGRTRDQRFEGEAEYGLIKAAKAHLSIPVIVNGDIDSPAKARAVLDYTGADGVMIGRASYGNPWIFGEIARALGYGEARGPITLEERKCTILKHFDRHIAYYGEGGLRQFRKHLRYYLAPLGVEPSALNDAFALSDADTLRAWIVRVLEELSS